MSAPHITLYGIANCDSVRKSRQWFAQRGAQIHFHDWQKRGLPAATLAEWVQALGAEALINRRGRTWRQLDSDQQAQASAGAQPASALLLAHPSLIKRPVATCQRPGHADIQISLGYAPETWAAWLAHP